MRDSIQPEAAAMTQPLVRSATRADLDRVEEIIEQARAYLAAQGSPQWQNGYGPNRASLARNLEEREGYVLLCGGSVCGYAALIQGIDEVYTNISGGQWDAAFDRYISIHSMAIGPAFRGQGLAVGFLQKLADTARDIGCRDVRIDTHALNSIMQRAILKAGFVYRGIVHFPIPDGERLAYQLMID